MFFSKINFSFDKKKQKFDHKIIFFYQKIICFDRIKQIFDQKKKCQKKIDKQHFGRLGG